MSGTGTGSAPPRPRQVLVSGVVAAAACGLLVLTLFDTLTRMDTVEVRHTITDSLAGHNSLGLSVSEVLGLMRVVTFVSGALAAAGVVLAVYALQRHRGARVGLSVVAVILVFTATLVAGLLPLLVGLATLRLWSRDARDWFDGRPARERRPASPTPVSGSGPGPEAPGSGSPVAAAWPPLEPGQPPTPPGGPSGEPPGPQPAPAAYPFGTAPLRRAPVQPPTASRRPDRGDGRRPPAVALACWLTWVLCGLLAVFLLLVAVVLTGDSATLLRELQRNPQVASLAASDRQLLDTLWLIVAFGTTWALAAIALAVLAYRRLDGARIALVVSAILAAVVGVVLVPVGWLHAAGAVTTAVLLLRRPARDWYAGATTRPSTPTPRQPPPPPPPSLPGPPAGSGPTDKPPVW